MTRLLLVDDAETDRQLLAGLLEEEGHELQFALDGQDAVERLAENGFDLVVTDLFMPRMDGLELVASIARDHPSVPVVLVTSQGSEELAVKALRAGAASYVPKRLLAEHLVDTIDQLLEAVHARRERRTILSSMNSEESSFVLPNDRLLFGPLVSHFQELIGGVAGWDETVSTQLGVALEEALVNAMEHGNLELDSELRANDRRAYYAMAEERRLEKPFRDRRVRLDALVSRSEISFTICDEGPGFDPSGLPDPTDPENLLKTTGRGIFLMRTFMDEVSFNETGNEVTLRKRVADAS